MADHPEFGSSTICIAASFTPGSVSLSAHSLTVAGFEWGRKNVVSSANPPRFNPNMSESVQLLLSDRIFGMTLVPEGKVWNYGIGLDTRRSSLGSDENAETEDGVVTSGDMRQGLALARARMWVLEVLILRKFASTSCWIMSSS